MEHYEHWREDLALAPALGVRALRWGVPWYRVEPERGKFDWRWTDEVIPYLVEDLGITPIIDFVHYGCPLWLHREFANPDYPRAVAVYAEAFAERYCDLVHWYTPVNEPLMTSLMCGQRGLWPPYLRGDSGYIRVMLQLSQGAQETVKAIKTIDPRAVMVHVEAVSAYRAATPDLQMLAVEDQQRGYLHFDLLEGRVTPEHPLYSWLVRNGARTSELREIAHNRVDLDVVGLNFYPQWSSREWFVNRSGRLANRATDPAGNGFESLVEEHFDRYQVPIMITETSAAGDYAERAQWLHASVAAVHALRGRGIPVVGYTWFPLFTMIDWRYRFGNAPASAYRIELGLYALDGGVTRWRMLPLAAQFAAYASDSTGAVGPVAELDLVR